MRALAGTAVGFFVGAGLVILIGSDVTALWVALPIAVLIAAYTPGTFPFAIGQAFFTVTISILYNILVPVGWKVGVIRLEDVAIGAGVSAIVGAFLAPRRLQDCGRRPGRRFSSRWPLPRPGDRLGARDAAHVP